MHNELLDNLSCAVAQFDKNGFYLYYNHAELTTKPLTNKTLKPNFFELFKEQKATLKSIFNDILNEKKTYINFEYTNNEKHYQITFRKLNDTVLAQTQEITSLKILEDTIQKDKENIKRLDDAVKGANIGVWDFFPQEGRILANDTWVTQKKYQPKDFKAKNELFSDVIDGLNKWASIVHPDDLEPTGKLIEKHLNGETEYYEAEFRMKCGDGQYRWIYDLGQVFQRDKDGTAIRMNGVHIDITKIKVLQTELQKKSDELEKLIKHLEYISSHDELTGIYNRRKFFELASKKFELNAPNLFVVMIDIDNFKNINDTYGHHTGDIVLKETCSNITNLLDEGLVFARIGGEEFAIVGHKEEQDVIQLVETIRSTIENHQILFENQKTIQITISSGVSFYNVSFSNIDTLLKDADKALYTAKDKGRNRTIVRNRRE